MMSTSPTFKNNFAEKTKDGNANTRHILNILRNGQWIEKNNEPDDLCSLLPVLTNALNMREEIVELCASLPWHDEKSHRNKALDLIGLLNAMAELGFVAQPLKIKLTLNHLDTRLCHCLFVYNDDDGDDHAIALLGSDKELGVLNIFDPRSQTYQTIDINSIPAGNTWVFLNEDEIEGSLSANVLEASGHSWFRALMERFSGGLWQVIAMGAMLTFLSLAAPLFVMLVYDRVISAHAPETLMPLLFGALLGLGMEAVLRLVRAHSLSWYGARLSYIVGWRIFERLLSMPVMFTERASIPSQIARIKAFDAVSKFFTGSAFLAMVELPFTTILMVAIVIIAGPLVFIPIAASVLYLLLVFVVQRKLRTLMRLSAKANSSKQEMLMETFDKLDGLRAGGLTSIWFRDFRDRSGKASMSGFHSSFLAVVLETFSHGIYLLAGLSTIVWGVIHIWAENMSAGALIAVMILNWRVLAPLQTLANSLPRYEQMQNAVTQINRLMTIDTEDTKSKTTTRLDSIKGKLQIKKVGLRYNKLNDPVFSNLNFDANPGELIAIAGGNGVGKTTVLKLINSLYRPQAGAIYIDGVDTRQINTQDLRRNISYVPQLPISFYGTIAENLRLANPMANDADLYDVIEKSGLSSYVDTLPDGIYTNITMQEGVKIPSALSYNLNLARAYIKNTPIMLIDEMPYAFLNSAAGETFKKTLKQWRGKKTVVFVSNREDYLELADTVVLLRSNQSAIVAPPTTIIQTIYSMHNANQQAAYA